MEKSEKKKKTEKRTMLRLINLEDLLLLDKRL